MHVFGHYDVAVDVEFEAAPDVFECGLQHALGRSIGEQGLPMITGEGQEVSLSGFVKALQAPGHKGQLTLGRCSAQVE